MIMGPMSSDAPAFFRRQLDILDLDSNATAHQDRLSPLRAHFHVPTLIDKPQDPIVSSLLLRPDIGFATPPAELRILTEESSTDNITHSLKDQEGSLWTQALKSSGMDDSHALCWDSLRPSMSTRASRTCFFSEQDSSLFAAARLLVQPELQNPGIEFIRVTQDELLRALKVTMLGTSSELYIWDTHSETFLCNGSTPPKCRIILIHGRDKSLTDSVVQRFLTIGTLLRRLENLVSTSRSRHACEGPTIHALTHAMASLLVYFRESLARAPRITPQPYSEAPLVNLWSGYSIYEDALVALSEFCHRQPSKSPIDYLGFDPSPAVLLSQVYEHLELHVERRSPSLIVGMFAYLLTRASQDYIQQICHSVGFGVSKFTGNISARSLDKPLDGVGDDDEDTEEENTFDRHMVEAYPVFFPADLADALPSARKSIELLRSADPDHPLLEGGADGQQITWYWTELAVNAAWASCPVASSSTGTKYVGYPQPPPLLQPLGGTSEQVLKRQFAVFDLEPGSSSVSPLGDIHRGATALQLESFLDNFPDQLPPLTPTLPQLVDLVLSPLAQHVATVSSSLLRIYLSPSSPLNLHAHLTLLRSYLLLTSSSFKSKLSSALFTDITDDDPQGTSLRSAFRSRSRSRSRKRVECDTSGRPRALGLASALTERDTWPPGGADLSFLLRTVIVDSIERTAGTVFASGQTDDTSGREQVSQEAEFRLGFAIRDLPVGTGRDRWLNPLCIEALDFLYMDYKPPPPLVVLISPEILSKYQRMFAFLLRMMRVESALRTVFRMTRDPSKPLFPTLVHSNKLLLHFRFVASSFVQALSEYVFDTAIGANLDAFLFRLSPEHSALADAGGEKEFSDIYSLAAYHSSVLDDVLTACLLRSGQRAVSDLLRGTLELVLEFSILAGQLHCRLVQEYAGASQLEDLHNAFRSKMQTLVKVLQALVEKTPGFSDQMEHMSSGPSEVRVLPGGTPSLYHFLIRLDMGSWWAGAPVLSK